MAREGRDGVLRERCFVPSTTTERLVFPDRLRADDPDPDGDRLDVRLCCEPDGRFDERLVVPPRPDCPLVAPMAFEMLAVAQNHFKSCSQETVFRERRLYKAPREAREPNAQGNGHESIAWLGLETTRTLASRLLEALVLQRRG